MKTKKHTIIFSFILLLVLSALPAFSQYYPIYYGRSKVMKYNFDWQVLETPNFRIHFYGSNTKLIKKMAVDAEKYYEDLSQLLNIQVKKKIPIIFYKTHFDFEQTNLYPGFIPAGAAAFAEPIGQRIVLQGDLSPGELTRTLLHELGHIFEYTVIGRSIRFKRPPLWVMEGFSDYITGFWRSFDLLMERDMVLNDRIPEVSKSGHLSTQYRHGRTEYNWGHLLYDFIEEKFGKRGVRKLLYSVRSKTFGRSGKNFFKLFDYTPKLFNYDFKKYVRKKFERFVTKENPEEYSFSIGPDFPFAYAFSHQVSPGGELVAVLTGNMKNQKLDIILISMKDGKVIKNLTPGFTSRYDQISLQFNPEEGTSIAWDNQGEKIAYFASKETNNFLIITDILTGEIQKKIKLEKIQTPASPNFHPHNKKLYFTGIQDSQSFVYATDLETGEIRRITDGRLFIKAINISSDGKKMVFSAQGDKYHHLYIGPTGMPESAEVITSGDYNNITPVFSKDGNFIYYSSDELESYNLCGIDLRDKTFYRYTDVRTGNFIPLEIPGEDNKLIFSSFYKGLFHLFKKDISTHLEKKTVAFKKVSYASINKAPETNVATSNKNELVPAQKDDTLVREMKNGFARQMDAEEKAISEPGFEMKELQKYKPFKTLFVNSLPPITAGFGSDGSLFGYTAIGVSDLMGDHNFNFMAASFYGYRSYNLAYFNLKNRIQYFANLFYFTDAFWINYNAYLKIRETLGGSVGFFYPFSRDYRAEVGASFYHQTENYDNLFIGAELPFSQFFDGPAARLDLALVGETTRFAFYGPNMGHTFRIRLQKYLSLGDKFLDATNIEVDLRKYIRLNSTSLLAFRLDIYSSKGKNPQLFWLGGDNTIRATEFRRLVGNNAVFFNAELRFPLINFSSTILGFLGPVRGVAFFDVGGVWMNEQKFKPFEDGRFKLKDALSSYGVGLNFFLFGYPFHIEWVYQTDFYAKKFYGVNFWLGFDF